MALLVLEPRNHLFAQIRDPLLLKVNYVEFFFPLRHCRRTCDECSDWMSATEWA
jgi:hypothetical protein